MPAQVRARSRERVGQRRSVCGISEREDGFILKWGGAIECGRHMTAVRPGREKSYGRQTLRGHPSGADIPVQESFGHDL
jgi:hypothetical protein